MRIFIGLTDTASQASDLKKGFARLGVESYAAILEPHAITANAVDKILARRNFFTDLPIRPHRLQQFARYGLRRQALFKEMAKSCDVFIFIWQSFYEDASDFEYLKKLGKKIVVFFMGDEQRRKTAYEQEMKLFGIPSYFRHAESNFEKSLKRLNFTLRYLRNAEKFADVIYSLPNQSQLSLRPYSHLYIPVDTRIIEEKTEQRKIPVIAHAPSNRLVKGTDFILNALDKLKNEGVEFELRLIENVPYRQALKMYTDSDILIGELFIPTGGKLDREALAAGKVVLSSARRDYIDGLPADCPIIDVNPETVYDELKKIILDYPRRVELAKLGRSFVEKYHDISAVCRDVLDKLEKSATDSESFDFYPNFFREKFVPENTEFARFYNRWTKFVGDADWYKEYVRQGKRDGLIF